MKPSPRLFLIENLYIATHYRREAENKYRIIEFTFRRLFFKQIKDQLEQRLNHEEANII